MRAGIAGLIIFLLPAAVLAQEGVLYTETPVVRVAWGEGPDQLGHSKIPTQLFPGPLFDVEKGQVFLIDRMKARLLVFDATGTLVRNDSLPAEVRLDAPRMTDFRSYRDKVFWMLQDSTNVQVFCYDPSGSKLADLDVRVPDRERQAGEGKSMETYKLALAPMGLYLLNRISQQAELIYDTGPVPPQEQAWKEGMPVGGEWIHWGLPFGEITGSEGNPLIQGAMFFYAAGDSCALVSPKDSQSRFLQLFHLKRGLVGWNPRPNRERGAVTNIGARYRIEDGYYEMYFDKTGATISRWGPPKN